MRFGLLALVPVVALGAVLARELNADIQQRYLETSRRSATLITKVGIQPLLDAQQVAGGVTVDQVAVLDARLQGASLSTEVRRLKVWNNAGLIVYSDNHSLIGRTFTIDGDLREALDGASSASVTNGHDEENSGDNLVGPLIQVYVPLVFRGDSRPSGAFELYLPYAPVQVAIDAESRQLYLVLAAGLLLFYLSMFPVVLLADRWRRRLLHEAENTALANLAVLERLNRLKSEFLTRISHQFRTSMVGIQGFSEVIKDADELDLDEIKSIAADIYQDAERLDRAFGDMLALDQMEAGRSKLARSHRGRARAVSRTGPQRAARPNASTGAVRPRQARAAARHPSRQREQVLPGCRRGARGNRGQWRVRRGHGQGPWPGNAGRFRQRPVLRLRADRGRLERQRCTWHRPRPSHRPPDRRHAWRPDLVR